MHMCDILIMDAVCFIRIAGCASWRKVCWYVDGATCLRPSASRTSNFLRTFFCTPQVLTMQAARSLHDDIPPGPAHCKSHMCNIEVFAACHRWLALLCFDHFEHSEPCADHKKVLQVHFQVDGFDRDTVEQPEQPSAKKIIRNHKIEKTSC